MILGKAAILAASDLKRISVEVPEWGEGAAVLLGELSAQDRLNFWNAVQSEGNQNKHYAALALTWFIIDEDGARVFNESDADALATKNVEVLNRLFAAAKKLNKMDTTEEDVKN